MKTPKQYWDNFHKEHHQTEAQPNSFLKTMLPRLQKGVCLDVAMGDGSNAVFLAEKGHEVIGFDLSPIAIATAQQRARDKDLRIEAKVADLDLYLFGVMKYDSIVMTYFKPSVSRYYGAMISALKQGGTLLIESYGMGAMQEPLGPEDDYRNIYFSSNEVLRQLQGMKILFYQEGYVDGAHRVQCLAQKPSDKHALKHDVFGMHAGKQKPKDHDSSRHLEIAEQFFKS